MLLSENKHLLVCGQEDSTQNSDSALEDSFATLDIEDHMDDNIGRKVYCVNHYVFVPLIIDQNYLTFFKLTNKMWNMDTHKCTNKTYSNSIPTVCYTQTTATFHCTDSKGDWVSCLNTDSKSTDIG